MALDLIAVRAKALIPLRRGGNTSQLIVDAQDAASSFFCTVTVDVIDLKRPPVSVAAPHTPAAEKLQYLKALGEAPRAIGFRQSGLVALVAIGVVPFDSARVGRVPLRGKRALARFASA
jgi:hypothetical protein